MNKPPKSGLAFDANFEHPTFQGATAPTWEAPGCHVLEQSRPERAKALRHGTIIEQNIHTVFHFKTAKSAIKQE